MIPFVKVLRGIILIKYDVAQVVQSVLGLFFLCYLPYSSNGQVNFKSLSEFPAYKLTSSQGKIFTSTMATKNQKPTAVVYFSPTCHHCQTQTTDITSNMAMFKGVQFLFVTAYPVNDTKPFLNDYAIERFDNIIFGYDSTFAMGRFFELKSLPGIFIYGKDKQLKAYFETNVKAEKLYSAIFDAEK
jgi:cytochrome oxidase Cu insertion factor (SCO1/SenC/PrrC family)